jgi:hypothetical protein
MIRRSLVVFAALAASVASAAPDGGRVTYRSPLYHAPTSGIVFDLREKHYGAIGYDTVTRFETCDAQSPFYCLYSNETDFALSVPKTGMLVGTTWRIGKFRFVIRHGGAMTFGGRLLSYSIIETIVDGAPQDHANVRAMYDPKFGLVCWAGLNWKDAATGQERAYASAVDTVCAEDIGLWPRGQ